MKELSQNFLTQRKRQNRTPFLLKPSPTSHHLPHSPPGPAFGGSPIFLRKISKLIGKFFKNFSKKLMTGGGGGSTSYRLFKSIKFLTIFPLYPLPPNFFSDFGHIRLIIPNTYEIHEFFFENRPKYTYFLGKISKKFQNFQKKFTKFLDLARTSF